MSDARTPTYDQLSALIAQMAATLQAITEMSGPMALKSAQAMAAIDLTAYRTLSPDPQWQRVPEGYEVVNLPSVNTIVDLIKHHVRVSVSNYGLSAEMEDMDDAAIAIINRARGEG